MSPTTSHRLNSSTVRRSSALPHISTNTDSSLERPRPKPRGIRTAPAAPGQHSPTTLAPQPDRTTPGTPTRAHALHSLWERESQERFTRHKRRSSVGGTPIRTMLSPLTPRSPVHNSTNNNLSLYTTMGTSPPSPRTAGAQQQATALSESADLVIGLDHWSPKRKKDSPKVMHDSPLIRNRFIYSMRDVQGSMARSDADSLNCGSSAGGSM